MFSFDLSTPRLGGFWENWVLLAFGWKIGNYDSADVGAADLVKYPWMLWKKRVINHWILQLHGIYIRPHYIIWKSR